MKGSGDWAEGAALWQRWRSTASGSVDPVGPDALALAAYADGRLDEAQSEGIEDWLADHPEALADLLAAQQASAAPHALAPESVIARAAALVSAPAGNVIPLTRRSVGAPRLRLAMTWGALAASFLMASLGGFALGNNAYVNLVGEPTAVESTLHELLDPPLNVFSDDEDQAT